MEGMNRPPWTGIGTRQLEPNKEIEYNSQRGGKVGKTGTHAENECSRKRGGIKTKMEEINGAPRARPPHLHAAVQAGATRDIFYYFLNDRARTYGIVDSRILPSSAAFIMSQVRWCGV